MHLDILIDMKLLLCSVSSPGIAFLINRKLLLCSVTSPRIALAILGEAKRWLCFFTQAGSLPHRQEDRSLYPVWRAYSCPSARSCHLTS